MKRLLPLLCAALMLTGCAPKSDPSAQYASWLTGAEPVSVSEWPDNALTAGLPRPESGEIDYIYDLSDSGHYAIYYKDISIEQGKAYVQALKESGWTEIASGDGGVSVGELLQKGDTVLSVALSEGILGLLITQTGAQK